MTWKKALVVVFVASLPLVAQDAATIRRGKDATAYVELPSGGSATAFCIDEAGYFVTNEHVTKGEGLGKIRLILNPAEQNQRTVEATVIAENDEADLSLLRVAGGGPFTALELGSTGDLTETNSLIAFGYPFGRAIATSRTQYPAATVSVGRITSLRKLNGALNEIQLDASLNPGNSGGPVLDERGRVVGIVQGGVPGAALNFAIPVDKLKAMLEKPVISFTPAPVPYEKRTEPQQLVAELRTVKQSPISGYQVELRLAGNSGTRTITMTPAGGKYTASARVFDPPTTSSLRAVVTFPNGSITGEIPDRQVRVGGRTIDLSSIFRIEREGAPRVTLEKGDVINGPVEGLDSALMDFGGVRVNLELKAATRIEIQPTRPPERQVAYTLFVRNGTETIAELRGAIALAGAPASAGSDNSSTRSVLEIAPLQEDRVVIRLPAPAENAIIGGGGRYLIFELRRLRQLAIFDVNAAKITNYLPLPSDNVKIAAGLDRIVILLADLNQLQRWNLRTMERDMSVNIDATDISSIAMGYASNGPLFLATEKGPKFYDVETMRPLDIKARGGVNNGLVGSWFSNRMEARASADGSVFAAWATNSSPSGVRLLVLDGTTATSFYDHTTANPLLPAIDGSSLFTYSGIYSADLKPLSKDIFANIQTAPSFSPAYFIGIKRPQGAAAARSATTETPTLQIYSSGDRKLLATLPEFAELASLERMPEAGLLDKRVFLIPQSELLATLTSTKEELILRRVNLTAEMDKRDVNYLFVASQAVRVAKKGDTYRYAIDAKSKKGGLVYKVESGPADLSVSSAGLVTWSVPASAQPEASVIISIHDVSGQEIYHSFRITVR